MIYEHAECLWCRVARRLRENGKRHYIHASVMQDWTLNIDIMAAVELSAVLA